jgi:hypothetical protein
MYKGTNEITNKGLGFKLTNTMSFGESMISTGFIQKTAKRTYMSEEITEFHHENYRLCAEARHEALPCGAGRPHLQAARPPNPPISLPSATSVFHRLLGCISVVP